MRNNLCIATPTNGLPFIPFSRICSQLARTKRLCHIADKPGTQIQHCIPHVGRFANAKLTQRPKTPTGQELRLLIRKMFAVCSRQENQQWINTFARWNRKYYAFLAERSDNITDGKERWWYTHRRLRAVRSYLTNALPYLFIYVQHPELPRTTNHLDILRVVSMHKSES